MFVVAVIKTLCRYGLLPCALEEKIDRCYRCILPARLTVRAFKRVAEQNRQKIDHRFSFRLRLAVPAQLEVTYRLVGGFHATSR